MSIGEISLGSATRANLLALQQTSKLLSKTQARLATGKKVNSSLDNATNFFAAKSFINTANDLANLKDTLSTAIQTVTAATDALSSIDDIVEQMQGLTNAALQTSDSATLTSLATQYNGLRQQIDYLITDATFNGTNLLNSTSASLSVNFNASGTSSLTISGVDVRAASLGVDTAQNAWANTADITAAQSQLQSALTTLRNNTTQFGSNNTLLVTRESFTSSLINTLQTAADNLTLADTNEESANLSALQAQSDLGVVALSVSGEQAKAILKLF